MTGKIAGAFATMFLVAAACAAGACGGGDVCEDGCAARAECGEVADDCVADCKESLEKADKIGCGDEFEDLAECVADEADCTDFEDSGASGPCDEQAGAAIGCYFVACGGDDPPVECK